MIGNREVGGKILVSTLKLLVIQSAYPYKTLCERNLLDFATSKDLDGFFHKVYTVHPAATVEMEPNQRERYGKISVYVHSQRHIFIESKVGRFWCLRKLSLLNFFLSQIGLLSCLMKLLWRDDQFLIRAEDPRYNGVLGFLLTRFKRIPFIVGTWGNPNSIRNYTGQPIQPRVFQNKRLEELCEKFLLRRADCVLVQNEDNFNYAVHYGAKKDKVKYFRLGNAIFAQHFVDPLQRSLSAKSQSILEFDGFKVATVSRLESLKLVDHTLRSFKEMKVSKDSHLYIFGDGSKMESLRELADELGLGNRIHFFGNVNQRTLAEVLPQMDLVISPSMGRALTEAALAAVPIVAYNTDCHPEIVKTGETGILVDYLDIKALAAAGDYMFENRFHAYQMGEAARAWTMELMNPEELMKQQRAIFSELLEKLTT